MGPVKLAVDVVHQIQAEVVDFETASGSVVAVAVDVVVVVVVVVRDGYMLADAFAAADFAAMTVVADDAVAVDVVAAVAAVVAVAALAEVAAAAVVVYRVLSSRCCVRYVCCRLGSYRLSAHQSFRCCHPPLQSHFHSSRSYVRWSLRCRFAGNLMRVEKCCVHQRLQMYHAGKVLREAEGFVELSWQW